MRVSLAATSSRKSTDAAQRRTTSPPRRLAMSTGSTPLPRDFENGRPCSSRVQPEVATILYGACPRTAMEVSRDEWNQPRCWSPPSVYRSAGAWSSRSMSRTACQLAPDSNQTSRMSISLRHSVLPQMQAFWAGSRSAGAWMYQASAPSLWKRSTMDLLTAGSLSGVWQRSQRKTAMGAPQMRWRETHQGGGGGGRVGEA